MCIPWFTSPPTSRFYAINQSVNDTAKGVYAAVHPLVHQPAYVQVLHSQLIS
jgi:hypothetical protein